MTNETCKTCKYLYIKDFVYGVCERPFSGRRLVEPWDSCGYWLPDERQYTQAADQPPE